MRPSVLEESRAFFSIPSNVLKILLDGSDIQSPAHIDSWEDMAFFFGCGSTDKQGSAWNRVQADYSFQACIKNYMEISCMQSFYSKPFSEAILNQCILLMAEMSIDYNQSHNLFTLKQICSYYVPENFQVDLEHAISLRSKHKNKDLFKLLGFCETIRQSEPNTVVDELVRSGIELRDIGRIRIPSIRARIRDCIKTASMQATPEWSEAKLRICARFDVILARQKPVKIKNRYSNDMEVSKVIRMLESDKPSDLSKRIPPAPAGMDSEQARQRALLINAHRVVSRQLGRAACNLGSDNSIVEESVINLNGKFGNVGIVSLDTSLLPIEALFWPEFHNGFSQAIQEPLTDVRSQIIAHKSKTDMILQSKKRIYGVPPEMVPLALHRHAGYLFGLLVRSSCSLRVDDIYRYLKLQNECVSSAVILGSCVSGKKSCTEDTAKLCYLHIPGQVSSSGDSEPVDIPLTVQSAALAGLGFLYGESGNRKVIESLFAEMGRKPVGDKPFGERESLAFSCGFSIGLLALGKGSQLPSDLALVDRLNDLIETHTSISPAKTTADNSARVSLIYETVPVNRQSTLPGACIGLGLSFLGSGDICVANRIRIPSTVDELENSQVRPDSLLFKYLAKSLIMLPILDPSMEFINSQLPAFIRDPVSSLEHREYRSAGSEAPSCIDWLALFQARTYAITGIALGIGLKYAGTNNGVARATLLEIIKSIFLDLEWPSAHCAAQNSSRPSPSISPDKATIQTCHACILLCLSMITAGTGDAGVYKYIRIFREKIDETTPFGVGQAADMSPGFLFLGNKKYSFKNDFFSIACLLAATVPRYPSSVSDNKSNIQLMRHLFVLATEERSVDVVDVGTLQPVTNERSDTRYFPVVGPVVQRLVGTLPQDQDPHGYVSSDRAYISEFSDPNDGEVRKLVGLSLDQSVENDGKIPLSWYTICPLTRRDWRLTISEIAAITLSPTGTLNRLKQIEESRDLLNGLNDVPLKPTERYVHLLTGEASKNRRGATLHALHEAIKTGHSLYPFLDSFDENQPVIQ